MPGRNGRPERTFRNRWPLDKRAVAAINCITVKILIVDDNESVRFLLKSVLRKTGCKVIKADDGDRAVDIVRNVQDIKLVIMDMKMQRMNGKEACSRIKAIRPEMSIIISSGHLTEQDETDLKVIGIDVLLRKPYQVAALRQAVDDLIAR